MRLRRDQVLLATFLCSSLLTLAIALDVHFNGLLAHLDARVEPHVLRPAHVSAVEVGRAIGAVADVVVTAAVALLVSTASAVRQRDARIVLRTAAALVAVGALVSLTRGWVHRPSVWWTPAESFPSGHSAVAVVVGWTLAAAVLAGRARALLWTMTAALGWGALVAWSRVIITAHWPSDTAAGLAMGLAVVSGGELLIPPRRRDPESPAESTQRALADRR